MGKVEQFFNKDVHDAERYPRHEDLPKEYQKFFIPDGDGFVRNSVATYADSARYKSYALRNNPATSFLRAYVDDVYVDEDMVQREDAEIAAAITDVRKEGTYDIIEDGAVIDTPDKIRVTFSYRGHDFMLMGFLEGHEEHIQEKSGGIVKKISSYRFRVREGAFDGTPIARKDFAKCENDFTAPIITRLQLLAQEAARNKAQKTNES